MLRQKEARKRGKEKTVAKLVLHQAPPSKNGEGKSLVENEKYVYFVFIHIRTGTAIKSTRLFFFGKS